MVDVHRYSRNSSSSRRLRDHIQRCVRLQVWFPYVVGIVLTSLKLGTDSVALST